MGSSYGVYGQGCARLLYPADLPPSCRVLRLGGRGLLTHLHDRFIISELNTLSLNGMATQRTESDNVPMIARESTMYQLNLYGYPDDAYTDATTLATLARLLRNQRQAISLNEVKISSQKHGR